MLEVLLEYMAKGFLIMLAISMPCVLCAAGIGLVVGILQAVTQVQEQTIAAAPKILGVFLVICIGGVGFIKLLTNLFQEGAVLAFNTVPHNEKFVLDSDPAPGNKMRVYLPDMDVMRSLSVGNRILLNDGKIELRL